MDAESERSGSLFSDRDSEASSAGTLLRFSEGGGVDHPWHGCGAGAKENACMRTPEQKPGELPMKPRQAGGCDY